MNRDGLVVRPVDRHDRDAVVAIARELVGSDTYAFDPDIADTGLWEYFAPEPPGHGYVAIDPADDTVVGAFVLRPVRPGAGAHVANGSYAVASAARGRGVGRLMGERSIDEARRLGFRSMQFNAVVASNSAAIHLWRSLGFEVIGTVPGGFRRRDDSYVDLHIMFRRLD